MVMHTESQWEEWKEAWTDDILRTVAAFASKDGGKTIIGKNDKGEIVGVRNAKKLLTSIPNTISNLMHFHPHVEAKEDGGKTYIVLTIKHQGKAIDYKGVYYERAGATTVRVNGDDLREFIMDAGGLVWTNFITDKIKLEDISKEAVSEFVKRGQREKRISSAVDPDDTEGVLRRYKLITEKGITNAAALLFGNSPTAVSYAAVTKIGLFAKEGGRLLMEDIFDGPVIFQPEEALKCLLDKYTQPRFRLKDHLTRVEAYRYPPEALREAILNAVMHRQYMYNQHTTIAVFPDHVEIHNPGRLPAGWTEKDLLVKHESAPANPLIAQAFHNMGQIEAWGVGVSLIYDECEEAGIPKPVYELYDRRIGLTFKSGPWSDTGEEPVKINTDGLTPSEIKIYNIIAEGKFTTAEEVSVTVGLTARTVKRATDKLVESGLIRRVGSKKTGIWEVIVE